MQPSDPALAFFLDRGLGSRVVPTALRAAGWQLTTMNERYGVVDSQFVGDEEWICEAAAHDEILLCKDLAIARNQNEAAAVHRARARVFALANANASGSAMVHCLLAHEQRIFALAARVPGPYVFAVSAERLRRCRLNLGREG